VAGPSVFLGASSSLRAQTHRGPHQAHVLAEGLGAWQAKTGTLTLSWGAVWGRVYRETTGGPGVAPSLEARAPSLPRSRDAHDPVLGS